ncbi:uncharacterized protein O3C94_010975 [Discoglossus pictus]
MMRRLLLKFLPLLLSLSLIKTDTCCKDPSKDGIIQHPRYIMTKPGDSVNISCSIPSRQKVIGVYFRRRCKRILYIHHEENLVTKEVGYEDRLELTGTVLNFTVTLKNLSKEDIDLYGCDGAFENKQDICVQSTVIVVSSNSPHYTIDGPSTQLAHKTNQSLNDSCVDYIHQLHICLIIMASIIALFIFSILIKCLYTIYEKRQSEKTQISLLPQNTVYEDMNQILRRNTMGNSNCYSNS